MNRMIYGECVRGASHVRSNIVCQDSYKKVELSKDVIILAAADGHGSTSCPYSKTGSVIATNVFCKVMEDILESFKEDAESLPTYLNREGEVKVAQAIDAEWKRRVWKAHTDNKREKPVGADGELDREAVYKQYGTTLLGLLITPKFIFGYQLGDGDILYMDSDGIQPVISPDKILGTETHSLSKMNSWKSTITMIRMRDILEDIPYLFMMSTDGFANSYASEGEFHQTCREYYELIKENGFDVVKSNLKDWLTETSEFGCGDDVTVVLAYFDK